MPLVTMLAFVRAGRDDTVKYMPNFDDEYRGQLAVVRDVIDTSAHPLERGVGGTPVWLKVRFNKDGAQKVLPSTRFLLMESRLTIGK